MKTRIKVVTALVTFIIATSVLSAIGQTQNRPAAQRPAAAKPPAGDFKLVYRTTSNGQTYQSSTMIKGARERSEMNMAAGMDIVTIMQCDLKRTIQLSDRARKYVVTPMNTAEVAQPAKAQNTGPVVQASRKGGVVTYTTTATDTGERKEMFGFTARHIKTSLTIDSSPDACNPTHQKMETDGWYIDLAFGIDCDLGRTHVPSRPMLGGGCQDRVQFKREGTARTGYAVSETTTMYGPDGRVMFTTSKEVVELSRAPLDAALFEVPAGYTEATDAQELYAMPSMSSMVGQIDQMGQRPEARQDQQTTASANTSAGIRVGVVTINNKTKKAVSIEALRERLVSSIQSSGFDSVALNAISPAEAEVEAKVKKCDFILYTDIATLKSPKLGGMFGRVTGVEGGGKTEAKIEYKLFAVGETTPRLQSSATAKQDSEEESAGAAIDIEAGQVAGAVKRRN